MEEIDDSIVTSDLAVVDTASLVREAKGLNTLAAIAIPKVMKFLFPEMYLYFWERCTTLVNMQSGFPKFALGIPRGFAKTAFLKLLIVFIILYTNRKFILVVAAAEDLAEAIISDVMDILGSNNIRTLFGDWDIDKKYDRSDAKCFRFRGRVIILKAKGAHSSTRGISENMSRPDVIICDDAQTAECAASPAQAMKYISWFRGTLMKAKSDGFCFFLYVGNMYKRVELIKEDPIRKTKPLYACQLRNLKQSKLWESLIVGAITSEGKSLWEELIPLDQLLDEYQDDCDNNQEDIFLAEMMNDDEAYNSAMFDHNKVPDYPFRSEVIPQGRCLVIDPSLGTRKSDGQEVGLLDVIDGKSCIVDMITFQVSAPMLVEKVLDWAAETNTSAIIVEAYAYQKSLGQWFEWFMLQEGITGINILFIEKGGMSKYSAIRSAFKEMMEGTVLLAPRVRAGIYSQARMFDPLKTTNEDGKLDIVSYAEKIRLKFAAEITYRPYIDGDAIEGVVHEVIDPGLHWG